MAKGAAKYKAGDSIKVINDLGNHKTVKVDEVITNEQGEVIYLKFHSGTIRHEDGREEPFFLTYPLDRVVQE